jgi:hypothetical protein
MEGAVSRFDTEPSGWSIKLGSVLPLVSHSPLIVWVKRGADGPSYNMIKKNMQGGDPNYRTSSGQHLIAAAEASELQSPRFLLCLQYGSTES